MKKIIKISAFALITFSFTHMANAVCVTKWSDLVKLKGFKALDISNIVKNGNVVFKAKNKSYVLISSGNTIVLKTPKGNATVNKICLSGGSLVADVSALGGLYKNKVTLQNAGANRVIVREQGNNESVTANAIY